jgi:hypothetical protein
MSHKIIGHLGLLAGSVDHSKRSIAARAACSSSQLYTYPESNTTVDATQPLTFKWNTGCDFSSKVDLYLYQPASAKGVIQGWSGVDYSKGEYQVNLKPSWWNGTETANLYVQILDSGNQPWEATTGPGPMFKLNYDASLLYSTTTVGGQVQTSAKYPAVTNGGDAIMQTVSSTNSNKGISKGAIAAAVIVPILVLAVIAGVAIRFWRLREAEKRRRWSAAVSTHSGLEWEKGARPGEKPASILGRPSTHFSARPHSMATSSVYAVENNMAGAGAGQNFPRPSFGQMRSHSSESVNRSSVVMPDGNVRQSRISFADSARPDRRSRMSLGDNLRPNIGRLPGGSRSASDLHTPRRGLNDSAIVDDDDEEGINISPTQMQGPNAFAEADMRRAAGNKTGRRSFMSLGGGDKRRMSTVSAASADDFKSAASARGSVDELRDMEAVMLMRRSMMSQYSKGGSSPAPEEQVEALENDVMPTPPPVAATKPNPTVAYGPDQMLAVYAARGKVSATPMPPLPAPGDGDMRSYVHLNTGTVSSAAVEALPAPGPRHGSGSGSSGSGSLIVPGTRSNARMSGSSEVSTYSDDAEVGEAK